MISKTVLLAAGWIASTVVFTTEDAVQAGELTWNMNELADSALVLGGGSVLLGLGLGTLVSGAVVYLYKRNQINHKLRS